MVSFSPIPPVQGDHIKHPAQLAAIAADAPCQPACGKENLRAQRARHRFCCCGSRSWRMSPLRTREAPQAHSSSCSCRSNSSTVKAGRGKPGAASNPGSTEPLPTGHHQPSKGCSPSWCRIAAPIAESPPASRPAPRWQLISPSREERMVMAVLGHHQPRLNVLVG